MGIGPAPSVASVSRPLATLTRLACVLALLAAPASAAAGWSWPVAGDVITHYRNGADPYAGGQHRGIDIAAEAGRPVVAAAGGTVRFAAVAGSSGLTVSVRTVDGRFDTSYLHLSALAVREGDAVSTGDRIGTVGTSGRRSAEIAHLHFGVREAGTRHAYVDPLTLLGPPPPAGPPDAPRVVPVPESVPVVPVPVGVPEPVRLPAARRLRLPAGRRVPVARRMPAGNRLPAPAPRSAPVPGGAPAGAPALRPLPALGRAHAAERGRTAAGPDRATLPGLGPHVAGTPAGAPAARAAPAGARPAPDGRGPDLGWALACLGLLLAAALMGRAREGGRGAAGAAGRAVRPDPRAALRAGVLKLRSKGGARLRRGTETRPGRRSAARQ